jgi:GxxExxY protein
MIANASNNTEIIYPELSYKIMGAIFDVHKELGPGFLESIYEKALIDELDDRKLQVEIQKPIDIIYKGKQIGIHRVDLIVEDKIIIELKTVERFNVHHRAQLISYLKASGYKLGILVNFSKSRIEYTRVVIR